MRAAVPRDPRFRTAVEQITGTSATPSKSPSSDPSCGPAKNSPTKTRKKLVAITRRVCRTEEENTLPTPWNRNELCQHKLNPAVSEHHHNLTCRRSQLWKTSGNCWTERNRNLERETGFEPATSTLARSHSTTELLPLGIEEL